MRFTQTKQGFVVFLKGQYYVVNELTFKLLKMYHEKKSIAVIAETLKIEEDQVQCLYNEISDQLTEVQEFTEEIEFLEPLKVQWKITNQCNIRCKHCYEGEKCAKQLSEEQISAIFEKLLDSHIQQLSITGGEALLVKNLAGHVRKCLEKGIMVNIFTNGILLNKFVDELGEITNRKLLTFQISVDGSQNEHNYIRGIGNFEKTTSNIRYAIKKGYKIITNTVVNGITRRSIIPMMKELHDMGVSTIQLSNLMLKGWANDNKDELYISKEELNNLYKEISYNIDFPFFFADISNTVYKADGAGGLKKEGKNTWKCCAGEARITIDFNGDVLLCPLCPNYTIGNLTEMSLSKIWDNPLKKDYIDQLRSLNKGKQTCFIYDQDIKK